MPFSAPNLSRIPATSIYERYTYRTDDTLAEVGTSGYFSDAPFDLDLDTGPVVEVVASDGSGTFQLCPDGVVATKMPSAETVNGLVDVVAPLSISGLTITVGEINLTSQSGSNFQYTGGSITAIQNRTCFLALTTKNKKLVTLDRAIDTGVIYLAKFTANSSLVTIDRYISPKLPESRISSSIEAVRSGAEVKVALMGSSLLDGAGDTPFWRNMLFDSSTSSFGYNVDNLGTTTQTNYAVGGMGPVFALSQMGNPCVSWGKYGQENSSFLVNLPKFFKVSSNVVNQARLFTSRSKIYDFDLVIIGLLANEGFENLEYVEACIKRLRAEGVEVIVVTDNTNASDDFSDTYEIWEQGYNLKNYADKYGCEIADTAAFVREQNLRGNNPYADSIHQSLVGQEAWAESVSSLLDYNYKGINRKTIHRTDKAPFDKFPANVDVCLGHFDNSGTSFEPRTIQNGGGGAYMSIFGFTSDYTLVSSGNSLNIGHPCALGFHIIFEKGATFTGNVRDESGAIVATIENTGAQVRPYWIDVSPVSDNTIYTTGEPENRSFQLEITSGALRLLAVGWYVPEYDDITLDVHFQNSDEAFYQNAYGERLNSFRRIANIGQYMSATHDDCRSIIVVAQQCDASGTFDTWANQSRTQNVDLYSASNDGYVTKIYEMERGQNTVLWDYKSVNPSAVATTSKKHRGQWVTALALLDR